MRFIKAFFGLIFNPLNTITNEKVCNKVSESFGKYSILRFIFAVIITAVVMFLGYFVL